MSMTAKEVTKQMRLKQWEEIIRDRCSSGLKVDDYCKQQGISRHTYYYWLREVRKNAIGNSSAIVEVTPKAQTPCTPVSVAIPTAPITNSSLANIVIQKGDITISVNSDVSPQLLMTVMRFLSNA